MNLEMKRIRGRFQQAEEWLTKHSDGLEKEYKLFTFVGTLALPILEGLQIQASGKVEQLLDSPLWWGMIALHIVVALRMLKREPLPASFYHHYRNLLTLHEKTRITLADEVTRSGHLSKAVRFLGMVYRNYSTYEEQTEDLERLDLEGMKRHVRGILEPISDGKMGFFGCTEKEYFNAAVYFVDKIDGTERLFLLERITNIPKSDIKNRSWESGQGQVGYTYIKNRTIITPNVERHPELSADQRDEDNKYYLSLAAIPLRSANPFDEHSNRLGVFIVTSSVRDRFSTVEKEILETILANFAFVFSRYLDKVYSKLLDERRRDHGTTSADETRK